MRQVCARPTVILSSNILFFILANKCASSSNINKNENFLMEVVLRAKVFGGQVVVSKLDHFTKKIWVTLRPFPNITLDFYENAFAAPALVDDAIAIWSFNKCSQTMDQDFKAPAFVLCRNVAGYGLLVISGAIYTKGLQLKQIMKHFFVCRSVQR